MTISNREICLSKDGGCLFPDCLFGGWFFSLIPIGVVGILLRFWSGNKFQRFGNTDPY